MAVKVAFTRTATGETKTVKVGWSWTLFLFGTILGIPLWMRKIYPAAVMMVVWDGLCVILPDSYDQVLAVLGITLCVSLGLRGNKETARYYLKHGWELAEPDSEASEHARAKWAIA